VPKDFGDSFIPFVRVVTPFTWTERSQTYDGK